MKPDRPALQLQSIELKDFKSIAHTKVNLHPLTAVVGANSSGKSSLIQAILALSQAVRYGDQTDQFPLNGEVVRLGTFDETKYFKSEEPDSPIQISVVVRDSYGASDDVESTEWSIYLISDGNVSSGTSRIKSLRLKFFKERFKDGDGNDIKEPPRLIKDLHLPNLSSVTRSPVNGPGLLTSCEPWWWGEGGYFEPFWYKMEYNCDSVLIAGGIPEQIYANRKVIDSYAYSWLDHTFLICSGEVSEAFANQREATKKGGLVDNDIDLSGGRSGPAIQYAEEHIRKIHSLFTHQASKDRIGWSTSDEIPFKEAYHSLVKNNYRIDGIVGAELDELSEQIRHNIAENIVQLGPDRFRILLRERFSEEPWADEIILDESEKGLGQLPGSNTIKKLFKESIKYLGPLRANPRPLYDYGLNQLDLGVYGEYTAAVLHTQSIREVQLYKIDGSSERTTLVSALAYWMQEFGIADSSLVEDRGRLGFDLRVSLLSVDRTVDLTSVGVGVSQVLPVIVLCLLAEPGDLVILEQPELHLHPALQQKLADFLLECTRSGRQILVETHSEHLINRLRRRVAEDDSDETQSLIGLLFAEQHDGQTTFYESKINAYGGLSDDWPDGFLNLGALEAQSLVRSSVYKHRRMRSHPLVSGLVERLGSKLMFTTGAVPVGYLKADTNSPEGFSLRVNSRVATKGTLSLLAIGGARPDVLFPSEAKLHRYLPDHELQIEAYISLLQHCGIDLSNYGENQRPSLPYEYLLDELDDLTERLLALADRPS